MSVLHSMLTERYLLLWQHRIMRCMTHAGLLVSLVAAILTYFGMPASLLYVTLYFVSPILFSFVLFVFFLSRFISRLLPFLEDTNPYVLLEANYEQFLLAHPLPFTFLFCGLFWTFGAVLLLDQAWLASAWILLIVTAALQVSALLYWAFWPLPIGLNLIVQNAIGLVPYSKLKHDGDSLKSLRPSTSLQLVRMLHSRVRSELSLHLTFLEHNATINGVPAALKDTKASFQRRFQGATFTANYLAHRLSLILIVSTIAALLVEFSAVYWSVKQLWPTEFSDLQNGIDAILMAVGILATFGFVGTTPTLALAKTLVITQALLNIGVLAVSVFSLSVLTNQSYEIAGRLLQNSLDETEYDLMAGKIKSERGMSLD